MDKILEQNFVEESKNNDYGRTMSSREREEFLPFLLARDGYVCNSKRGDGCGKNITMLLAEDNVRKEFTGRSRKRSLLVIDHEDNDSTHNHNFYPDGTISEYCANLQLLCWGCNLMKRKSTKSTTNGIELTESQKHKRKNEPAFINMILDELRKRDHVCIKGIVAKGSKQFGSQVSLSRYLETELFHEIENPDGRFEIFDFSCSFTSCNGEHIARSGKVPIIETDEQRINREKLEREAHISGAYFFDKNTNEPETTS